MSGWRASATARAGRHTADDRYVLTILSHRWHRFTPVSPARSHQRSVSVCVQPDGFGGDIYEGDWADNQVRVQARRRRSPPGPSVGAFRFYGDSAVRLLPPEPVCRSK